MKTFLSRSSGFWKRYFTQPVTGKLLFFLMGIVSTVWFLVRVIPKPSRAAYPCMKTASPVMASFVMYLLGLTGAWSAYRKSKLNFVAGKYLYAVIFLLAAVSSSVVFFVQNPGKVFANPAVEWIVAPNEPVGDARGTFPGRVVWVHDPKVARWDGTNGFWWEDVNTSQDEADKMVNQVLQSLTGEKKTAKAWKSLFVHFNQTKKGKAEGYEPGQKIAVKINMNNNSSQSSTNQINASPQLTLALLRTLVRDAKVPERNITVFDASRFIPDEIFDRCHKEFPEVVFLDNVGGNGRAKATYIDNAIPYSADNGKLARGLATCAVEADYLINMALLKGHGGQGVTLCGKNYYGVTSIENNWRKNFHNNFNPHKEGKPRYMTFVDFMGHKDLGEKTMLFLIDGLYGCKFVAGKPGPKWQMEPFNGNWPCSLFASQDGVAIDAVGLDFFRTEFPDAPDMAFSDQYLIEAALANNPPSGTIYDPEKDGTRCKSLGVMEHWNNKDERKYSRNFGKNEGIELIQKTLK